MNILNAKWSFFIAINVLLAGFSIQSHAINLSQSPLFLSEGVDPNVMYILDDSGSMKFELMPEDLRMRPSGSYVDIEAVFPPAASMFSVSDESAHMAAPGAEDNVYGALVRSTNNTIYYDPSIQYKPWRKFNGEYFDDAQEACAFHNPMTIATPTTGSYPATFCRDLTKDEVVGRVGGIGKWKIKTVPNLNATTVEVITTDSTPKEIKIGDALAFQGGGSQTYRVIGTSYTSFNKTYRLTISPPINDRPSSGGLVEMLPGVAKCTAQNNCTLTPTATFYPATYWSYNPGVTDNIWDYSKYTKHEIKPGSTYSGDGRSAVTRPDCLSAGASTFVSCTYEQEIQNFANWYTFYRSRYQTAVAGTGEAFSGINGGMRVGYGALKKGSTTVDDIPDISVVSLGVRDFSGDNKKAFYDALYKQETGGGTPLRSALISAAKYFQDRSNRGPWSLTPETANTSAHASCRAVNTILMTDGYWNGDSGTSIKSSLQEDNPDNTETTRDGKTIYSPSAPFKDDYDASLADVAMNFWKEDLRDDLPNRVVPSTKEFVGTSGVKEKFTYDPATWQHMVTHTVGLGVEGTLSTPTNNIPELIRNKTVIDWPSYGSDSSQNIEKIDDLFHAAVNGRGSFFSAKNPVQFAAGLQATLRDISSRDTNSAAAAAANSTSLNTGSSIYTAIFNSSTWSGALQSRSVSLNGELAEELSWESSIPDFGSRNILSYNTETNKGVEFAWGSISDAQKYQLRAYTNGLPGYNSEATGQERLSWVQGKKPSPTEAQLYDLRARDTLMGDIVNSDPAYANNSDMGFSRLSAALGGASYKKYIEEVKRKRREVVYVGANDGMLHAFNGKNISEESTESLGRELFAYVPSQTYPNLGKLAARNYGEPINPHKYFVDGPAIISDAYVKGAWKNILVGTLGAGGKGIFVLDITDPDDMSASKVLFELTDAKYAQLGNITSRAIVAPAADGRWKIFLGNGYNSTYAGSDKAFLGIIDIDDEVDKVAAGASRTRFIATTSSAMNALAQPALLAGGAGHITKAYAGDLLGNLWKFELSSTTSSSWQLAFSGSPLFTAKIGYPAVAQPITASPTLGFNSVLEPSRVMVYFGTGRYVTDTDNAPDGLVRSFYAIADKEVAVVNNGTRASLHKKEISAASTSNSRAITGEVNNGVNAVTWASVSGWYLDFPPNERVITKPILIFDRLVFPTIIPSDDVCDSGGSGWLMELIAVGDKDTSYSVLGKQGNSLLDVPIYGQLSPIEGPGERTKGTATDTDADAGKDPGAGAPPPSNECGAGANSGRSGALAVLGNDSKGNAKSFVGGRPCDLYDRQSWRELE